MRRVYQRVRPRFAKPAALAPVALAFLLAACGDGAEVPAAAPDPPRDAARLHLASRSYELAGVGAQPPRLLADESSDTGVHAVEVPLAGGAASSLAAARGESRVLAVFADGDRVLLEIAGGAGLDPALHVRAAGGALRALPAPAPRGERFVGWLRGGAALATAGFRDATGGESLFEVDARSLLRRELDRGEGAFRIAAVDDEARFVALVRRLDEEADELVLRDRRRDESRLLLPTAGDGRFRPHLFLPDGDLLLSADDGSDLPRLERLDPVSGRRRPFALLPCPAESARLDAAGGVALELGCGGRREAFRVGLDGMPAPLPAVPTGTRLLRLLLGTVSLPTALAYGAGGWPSDLAVLDARGLPEPRTYGLAPRLPPSAHPATEPLAVPSVGVELPCELRLPARAPRGGVLWLEDPARPPRFDEHRPMPAALASHGQAVLLCRGRGSDGFGRAFRRAADGDPAGAALADLRAGAAALRARVGAGAPIAVVGEGAWWGAAALALAADEPTRPAMLALVVALFPDPDPLAPLVELAARAAPVVAAGEAATAEPIADRRWGDPTRPDIAARVEAWRFPVAAARTPTLVALDAADAAAVELAARIEAAAAGGAPVAELQGARSRLSGAVTGELARALVAAIGKASADDEPRDAVESRTPR